MADARACSMEVVELRTALNGKRRTGAAATPRAVLLGVLVGTFALPAATQTWAIRPTSSTTSAVVPAASPGARHGTHAAPTASGAT
jgi:hypothetical protein